MAAMMVVLFLLMLVMGCSESESSDIAPQVSSTGSVSDWSHGTNTPETLEAYVLSGQQPVPGYRLGAFLGKGEVIGKGTISVDTSGPLSEHAAYTVTFLCNPDRNVPYSIGIQKDGDERLMGYEEGCSGSIASLTMPTALLPDATDVVINAEQVIAVVFEMIQEEEQ
ncbi:hypothetical protein [Bifidobacterium cuniculi]|uniref:Lipoprotein n=1 Tax=Bifidobacterium cuniculi TaxID=1688 RepID=A0A087B3I1_9BIFI|nr:hypothetical protein [Bifidobacterium cuniculi]KFI65581.1 hypothetical protein BCUN_0074 [Bifidobacterium cuniculi]